MALASWSARRISRFWAVGLALQALLILTPLILARLLVANSADLLRVAGEQDQRWQAGDLADSLSLAKQRAESRAARTYSITATGDTLFPLVHVPSGRPDPSVVAHLGEQTRRKARFFTVALFGLIPSVLVLVTLSWAVLRRRDAGR